MKILLIKNGLLITPETDFEEQYIREYEGKVLKAFVKHGESLSDLHGLKIENE